MTTLTHRAKFSKLTVCETIIQKLEKLRMYLRIAMSSLTLLHVGNLSAANSFQEPAVISRG